MCKTVIFEMRVTGAALGLYRRFIHNFKESFERNNFWLNYFAINCHPDEISRKKWIKILIFRARVPLHPTVGVDST